MKTDFLWPVNTMVLTLIPVTQGYTTHNSFKQILWICKKNVQQVKMAGSKTFQLFTGNNNINFVLYLNIITREGIYFFNRSDKLRICILICNCLGFYKVRPRYLKELIGILVDFCYFGVRVSWSLVLCVCFVDRCLSFCPFYFGHCVVCP